MSSDGSSTRRGRQRQNRPEMEGLEGRALLSTTGDGSGVSASSVAATAVTTTAKNTPGALRRFDYSTAGGAKVDIQLFGVGSLIGTYVDPDGALNLRFSGTNAQTGIIGHVRGGSGHAAVRSIEHRFEPPQSLSGIGGTLLNLVKLKDFDLVQGGRINLTGGAHLLFLNSSAADTQISLRELPESQTTTGNSASASQNGVTYGFLLDLSGAQTLTSVGGQLVTGFSTLPSNSSALTSTSTNPPPGPPPAPPGVVVSINHVNGPARDSVSIGTPQIFAYDKTTDALLRYDTATGQPTLTIPHALNGNTAGEAGVALARVNGRLAVLVSDGSTIRAYDAINGDSVGSFALAPLKLAPYSLANPSRLGTFDTLTVVGDPTGGTNGLGKLQAINVNASLRTGQAVVLTDPATGNPIVPSYTSQRAFQFTGGFAGLPGSSTLYAVGAGHFDPYQPDQFQLGVAALSAGVPSTTSAGAGLKEASRTVLTGNAPPNSGNSGTNGTIVTNSLGVTLANGNLNNALGSVDQSLALITGQGLDPKTGAAASKVSLYSASSLSKQTDIYLDTTDNLTDLSGSFRPDLKGTALVDVQGNTQSFRSQDARGLVFNGEGRVNLVKIEAARDSTIIGFPFVHAQIPLRSNTVILSTTRAVGDRGGVIQVPGLSPTGPLSLP